MTHEPIGSATRRTTPTLVVAVVLLAATGIAGACELLNSGPSPSGREVPTFSPEIRRIVEGTNRFGLELFQTLNLGNRTEDPTIQLISPVGISASLAMLLEGARGSTREDIRLALGIPDELERQVLDAHTRVLTHMGGFDPEFFYESLQVLLVREGLRMTESYPRIEHRLVGAELLRFDFGHPKARPILNEWIEGQTRGFAPDLIDQLSQQDLLAVMNASYVVGPWRYRFDSARTGRDSFRTYDGSPVELTFMRQKGRYPYLETDSMRMASIPYGDSLFAMHLIVPRRTIGIHRMIQDLTVEKWHRWTDATQPTYLDLAMPKVTLSFKETLNNELSGIGLSNLFSTVNAEFDGIGPGNLAVNRFRHQSSLGRLTERGLQPPQRPNDGREPRPFHVDCPFLIVVSERASGAITFIGRVAGKPPIEPPPDRGPVPPPDDI